MSALPASECDIDEPRSPLKVPKPEPTPERLKMKAIPSSSLTLPEYNTAHLLKEKLHNIHRRLENDEISVSTILTTSTDRRQAARAVQKLDEDHRYKNLPSPKSKPTTQVLKKISKQVDPEWVYRKENFGPKTKDVEVLHPADPVVHLKVNLTSQNTSSDGKRLPSMQYTIDPSTNLPRYEMNVNLDDIFGSGKVSNDSLIDMISKRQEQSKLKYFMGLNRLS